jgi:hypothetical protein
MPRAADRFADKKTLGQWTAVMCADGSDREELRALSRNKDRLAESVPEQHRAIGEFRERYSLGEVGSVERRLCFVHSILLESVNRRRFPEFCKASTRMGRSARQTLQAAGTVRLASDHCGCATSKTAGPEPDASRPVP